MKISTSLVVLSVSLIGLGAAAFAQRTLAQTLPLHEDLTSLTSSEGQALLLESEGLADYIPLTTQFITQQNQAFCGVATTAMVLNALQITAPLADAWDRNYFTQENLFNDQTEAIISRSVIERQGMTLEELAGIFESYPVYAEVYHGSDVTLDDFRQLIADNLAEPGNFVVVNYLRRAIAQERGGHISPIGAYDADTDQFLIMDVSRYKYPPVWVSAEALWAATNTVDSVSGKTRGFLLISAE